MAITEERKKELRQELSGSVDRDMRKFRGEEISYYIDMHGKTEEERDYLSYHCYLYVTCEDPDVY